MFFKKKKDITTINDDLLGKLSFIKDSDGKNHWIGNIKFENQDIQILIHCRTPVFNKYQKKIFIKLKERYNEIKPVVEEFINKILKEKNIDDKEYSISDDFTINHILIFTSDNRAIEISYDLKNDFSCFEVLLEDYAPVQLGISA